MSTKSQESKDRCEEQNEELRELKELDELEDLEDSDGLKFNFHYQNIIYKRQQHISYSLQ